jgi:hypothetical protein
MDSEPRGALEVNQRPKCPWCGEGNVDLIEERPHPLLGILGMSLQKFKCDRPSCAKLTLD